MNVVAKYISLATPKKDFFKDAQPVVRFIRNNALKHGFTPGVKIENEPDVTNIINVVRQTDKGPQTIIISWLIDEKIFVVTVAWIRAKTKKVDYKMIQTFTPKNLVS